MDMFTESYIKEQGIVAKLFLPEKVTLRDAVIVLGGSTGGFNEPVAQALARKGYVALALAYFGVEGLPNSLENIPLEYFLNAIRWLKKQSQVKLKRVHVHGVSRGGEAVMLLASTFPNEIASVIAIVPSCVTYGGYPNRKNSAWTLNDKALPVAPAPEESDEQKQQDIHGSVNSTKLFLEKMRDNPEKFEAAMIKVEDIKCPLLIITGKDDRMWPSWLYGDMVMNRLDACKSSIYRKHLSYENVGHMILPSEYAPVITEAQKHPVTGLLYEMGGNKTAQAEANRDSWLKIVDFLGKFSQ